MKVALRANEKTQSVIQSSFIKIYCCTAQRASNIFVIHIKKIGQEGSGFYFLKTEKK